MISVDDIANAVLAWQRRHPLALRLGPEAVHSIGIVALPFVRASEGAEAPPPAPWWKRWRSAPGGDRARFSEPFIDGIGVAAIARFAQQHGVEQISDMADWPQRRIAVDSALAEDAAGGWPYERWLATAAVEGPQGRLRVLVSLQEREPRAVLGPRHWDPSRLAAAALVPVLLAAGLWALWPRAKLVTETPVVSGSVEASAAASADLASTPASSPASAPTDGVAASASEAAASEAAAGDAAASEAIRSAASEVPQQANPAAEPSVIPDIRPRLGPVRDRPPLRSSKGNSAAAAATAAPAASAPASSPAGATAAASAPAADPERPALRPVPAGSKPFAIASPVFANKAEAEAMLARMLDHARKTVAPESNLSGELFETPKGYRAAVYPFASREEAALINATMVARGWKTRSVEF